MTKSRFIVWLSMSAFLVPSLAYLRTASSALAQPQHLETWRKSPPTAGPPRPFKLPNAHEIRLQNGLTILLVEDHRTPLVTIEAGVPLAPPRVRHLQALGDWIALTESTAELLIEGAGSRTGSQLAREIESLGGRISSSANEDYVEISAVVVGENALRMIELFADVMLHPTFPQSEVALYKSNRIDRLKVQRQDPAFLAGERFDRIIYGSHQYGLSAPTPQAVRALTRTRIAAFHKSSFAPERSTIVVAGDFNLPQTENYLRRLFGDWAAVAAARGATVSQRPRFAGRSIQLIDRRGSEQADFKIGGRAVNRTNPDYIPLMVANAILGAGTGSRLFMNIREQKGYAYDVSSSVSGLKEAGAFFGSSQTRTEATASAIKEMLSEFERIASQKVSDQELTDAKSFINGQFALGLSTQGGVAGRLVHARLLGLPAGYLEDFRARVDRVTAERVQQVARKYIWNANRTIVVVGDAGKLAKQLRPIAPVEVFSESGRRIQTR